MNRLAAKTRTAWTLSEFGQGAQQQRTYDLPQRDLIVGRSSEADLTVSAQGISKHHARLTFENDHLVVEDLGSTNGTYLNGKRITCSTVVVGDLLQFANALFRVGRRSESLADGTIEEGIIPWAQTLLMFDRLLTDRAVVPHFQPIVTLEEQTLVAYELLARSGVEGLHNPAVMFGAAERLGQQAVLSELMREEGLKVARDSKAADKTFFLNTHPDEVITDRLVESLTDLRNTYPELSVTVEIHEAAITAPESMQQFRECLKQLDMQLSYDDFGAGQGRLLELTEVPPDVLKFDMQLIRGIDSASAGRQELLRSLVRIAKDSGATTLAEGVETEAEHATCLEMGFELGQGFLYGRPQTL